MEIGVDIRAALHEPAGIGSLALNFAKQLERLPDANDYYLYADEEFEFGFSNRRIHRVVKSFGRSAMGGMLWHVAALADARLVRRLDAFVSFGSLQIAALTKNFVVLVIPDLSHLLMPEFHVAKSRITARLLMSRALRNARHVVAISEHTKRDILDFMNGRLKESEITVAHAACDEIYQREPSGDDKARVRERYGLKGRYILTVGTLEPRKNLSTLFRAYAEILKDHPIAELVVAGKKGWLYDTMLNEVKKLGIESHVKFLGFVPLADMPALYSLAEVFVYPSLYEGFGIPPLEAMTCGVPVITSNVSSLPEVTGDAAILINPRNVAELSSQLKRLLDNPSERERLGDAGRERARQFSWQNFTQRILSGAEGWR
jgi:glycosyltransferase involved in cell wall biosynthesis